VSIPILLAVSGTVLMALAIFIPIRKSLAASLAVDVVADADALPAWPELVEPSATACDATARLDLVDALASLRSAWAIDVLTRAQDLETDPTVRAAIATALAE
jgi:hypothetical protein